MCHGPDSPYLGILDGVSGGLLQQLDGLVVVLGAAASHHVAQELHAVQLPIGVLGPGVVHKADLRPGERESERARERESWVRNGRHVNDGDN